MKKIVLCFFILCFSSVALGEDMFDRIFNSRARGKQTSGGLGLNLAFGYPEARIKRTTGDSAIYSGFSFMSNLVFPIAKGGIYSADFTLGGKYLDLYNNANSTTKKEYSSHYGGGAGLNFSLYMFVAGVDYYFMNGRHKWVGEVTDDLAYSYDLINYNFGLKFNASQNIKLALTYNIANSTVPKSKTLFTEDSPYSEKTIWLHLTFETGASLWGMVTNSVR